MITVVSSCLHCLTFTALPPVSFWSDHCLSLHIHGTWCWLVTGLSPPSQQMWLQQCCGHQRGRHSLFHTFITHRVRAEPCNRQLVLFFSVLRLGKYFFPFSTLPRWRCLHPCSEQPHLCVYDKITGIPGIKSQQKPGERGSEKSAASQKACPCVPGLASPLCRSRKAQLKGGLGSGRTAANLPAPNPYFWGWQSALTGLQDGETRSPRWGAVWCEV